MQDCMSLCAFVRFYLEVCGGVIFNKFDSNYNPSADPQIKCVCSISPFSMTLYVAIAS